MNAARLASPLKGSNGAASEPDLSEVDSVSVQQYQILKRENNKLQGSIKALETELQLVKSELMVRCFLDPIPISAFITPWSMFVGNSNEME